MRHARPPYARSCRQHSHALPSSIFPTPSRKEILCGISPRSDVAAVTQEPAPWMPSFHAFRERDIRHAATPQRGKLLLKIASSPQICHVTASGSAEVRGRPRRGRGDADAIARLSKMLTYIALHRFHSLSLIYLRWLAFDDGSALQTSERVMPTVTSSEYVLWRGDSSLPSRHRARGGARDSLPPVMITTSRLRRP